MCIGDSIDIEEFANEVDLLAASIKTLPVAEGVKEIYAPGERGDTVLSERKKSGIPLPKGTWDRLSEVAISLGIEMPETT